ncbi:MAG: type II toxin-antitoxin system RelE/ParE family toxin [Actinomyces sp.]|nr:MAG: type II toxin-antitoxin system RelE/ParE family toxin [Actinomyces sp.]
MARFHAVYYRARDGTEPVREFLDALDDTTAAVLAHQIDRLNLLSDQMPHLPFPHSSQVDGELRELRCHHGRSHYRILYRRSDRLLILLHIFAKRTGKIPAAEIAVAQQRWDDFKDRMNTQPRTPPRAAGHDAP